MMKTDGQNGHIVFWINYENKKHRPMFLLLHRCGTTQGQSRPLPRLAHNQRSQLPKILHRNLRPSPLLRMRHTRAPRRPRPLLGRNYALRRYPLPRRRRTRIARRGEGISGLWMTGAVGFECIMMQPNMDAG